MWQEVLGQFEKHAPASVMARIALQQAMPAAWIDEVFEANRQRQYPRELLFSTVVELMTLVSLGLQPSLHAVARKMEHLPVSLAALYDKVATTCPARKSAWHPCAGTGVRRCWATRWWCTTPTWRRWSIWWPARTPTRVSAPLSCPCSTVPGQAGDRSGKPLAGRGPLRDGTAARANLEDRRATGTLAAH